MRTSRRWLFSIETPQTVSQRFCVAVTSKRLSTAFSQGSRIFRLRNPDGAFDLINSVVDHHDEKTAKRGAFNSERLDNLEAYLGKKLKAPSRLAMMHHHPILHTGPYLDSSDVIPNGDALIDLLNKAGECGRVLVLEAGGPHRQPLTPQ